MTTETPEMVRINGRDSVRIQKRIIDLKMVDTKRWNLSYLAQCCDVSPSQVTRLINGDRVPAWLVDKVSEVLNLKLTSKN